MVRGIEVGAIWARWLEGLAGALFAARELWRAQRALVVAHENGQYIIRHGAPAPSPLTRLINKVNNERGPPPGTILAVVPEHARAPDEVLRAARNGIVALELPRHELVERGISVPAQAREFLPGIVRNRIERLSPWQAEQALYGFEVNDGDGATLDVRVFVTSRAALDHAQAQFSALGLPLDRIVARSNREGAQSVQLWSRLSETTSECKEQTRWRIGAAIVAVFALSVVLTIWAFSSAASMHDESEELAARANTLQRQLQGPRASPSAVAALPPAERAWFIKQSAPHAVMALEVLARALPDNAHLTELRLEGVTLRIAGLADDAPSLIAPLERTGHLTGVRFVAPTTRGADGAKFKFNIEAQIVPRLEFPDN
jgi:general secretion pathway protein L